MSMFESQLRSAIQATAIRSEFSVAWYGSTIVDTGPMPADDVQMSQVKLVTVESLARVLYNNFYCHGYAVPIQPAGLARTRGGAITPFLFRLSQANTGEGYWQPGWHVVGLDEDQLIVMKGLKLWVAPEACRPVTGTRLSIGTEVEVAFPKESYRISPSFYMAYSDVAFDHSRDSLVRLYWNIDSDHVASLMREVTRHFNSAAVPFCLKVVDDPEGYDRCDSAVLYFYRSDLAAVAVLVASLHREFATALGSQTPALTKRLGQGLALAEDPGQGMSYGQHRCRLVAESLIRAGLEGQRSLRSRLASVREGFAENGLNISCPYLCPESDDVYDAFQTQ